MAPSLTTVSAVVVVATVHSDVQAMFSPLDWRRRQSLQSAAAGASEAVVVVGRAKSTTGPPLPKGDAADVDAASASTREVTVKSCIFFSWRVCRCVRKKNKSVAAQQAVQTQSGAWLGLPDNGKTAA